MSYADGYAALTAVREDSFDLVLLAADLPRLCGLEVLSSLRKDQSDRPAIVILAEQGHRGIAAAAYELGADEVVFKPFTLGFMTAFSHYLVSDLENVTALEALEAIAV